MFGKLGKKWKISGLKLALVISTFAIGGCLCGIIGKKVMVMLHISSPWLWGAVYIIMVSVLWPACILTVSIVLGQFSFFKAFLHHLLQNIIKRNKNDQ